MRRLLVIPALLLVSILIIGALREVPAETSTPDAAEVVLFIESGGVYDDCDGNPLPESEMQNILTRFKAIEAGVVGADDCWCGECELWYPYARPTMQRVYGYWGGDPEPIACFATPIGQGKSCYRGNHGDPGAYIMCRNWLLYDDCEGEGEGCEPPPEVRR